MHRATLAIAFTLAMGASCATGLDDGSGGGPVGGASSSTSSAITSGLPTSTQSTGPSQMAMGSTESGAQFCPSQTPENGQLCYAAITCGYGEQQCACDQGSWHCVDCPLRQPGTGDDCDAPNVECFFGPLSCQCVDGAWDCGTCPEEPPMDEDPCPKPGLGCDYDLALHCSCSFQTGLWACGAPCPIEQPAPGAPCANAPAQSCPYGETACHCFDGEFFCN